MWQMPEVEVAPSDDPTESAERLEQALERIAALAARVAVPAEAAPRGADTTELADRLDGLIVRLRSGLGSEAE
jgi:hypothetical protein